MFLGIDMGGTNIRVAIVDGGGAVLQSRSAPLPAGPAARAALPAQIAREHRDRVAGAGLAVAGTVTEGVMTWSANLGLHGVDFGGTMKAESGLPVAVLNDARAAGLAEALVGAGRGAASVLSVTVGTGIGGALIVDRRLVTGTGDAGEIGHQVIDPRGPECTCGRRGCWERFVGGRAIAARAAGLYPGDADALDRMLSDAERDPASPAREAVDEITDLFRLGLDNLYAIFAPHVVVLGGGIMARNGLIANRYRTAAGRTRWGKGALVRDSLLGDGAGVIGAALAAAPAPRKGANHVPMDL